MKSKQMSQGTMPVLGLGTWKSDPGQVYRAVREAINTGYRHIDCASAYRNEKEIGSALHDAFMAGDIKREEIWITSKLWNDAHLQKDVVPALKQTLSDLQLDYLDLYLIHWPVAFQHGIAFPSSEDEYISLQQAPIQDTWRGMEDAVRKQLTRHIGVSNFSIKKIKAILGYCEVRPEVNQVELHPFLQQQEMLTFCEAENIAVIAYSPLGSSDRPAQFKGADEPSLLENKIIKEIATSKGCSPAQVLIAWAIQRGTAVIPKSVNAGRIKQNFAASQIVLNKEEMNNIAGLEMNSRYVVGEFFNAPDKGYTLETLWDE